MTFTYVLVVVPRVQNIALLVRVQSHRGILLKAEESKMETRINGKLKGKVRRESRIEQTSEATAPFLSNRASVFTSPLQPLQRHVHTVVAMGACALHTFLFFCVIEVRRCLRYCSPPQFFPRLRTRFPSTNPLGLPINSSYGIKSNGDTLHHTYDKTLSLWQNSR